MTIYVVLGIWPYEDAEIRGAYTDEEEANRVAAELDKLYPDFDHYVKPVELNK